MVRDTGKAGKGNEVHVYLLHFEHAIGKPQSDEERAGYDLPPRKRAYKAHARHYVGATGDLAERLHDHATGNGCRLVAAAKRYGTRFALAKVWYAAGWAGERAIKRQRNHKRFCPICQGEADFEPFDEDRLDEVLPEVADPFWPY